LLLSANVAQPARVCKFPAVHGVINPATMCVPGAVWQKENAVEGSIHSAGDGDAIESQVLLD
jgi:hypothetical protein